MSMRVWRALTLTVGAKGLIDPQGILGLRMPYDPFLAIVV